MLILKLKHIWWSIKCFVGFGSIEDGSICWFSKRFFDVHDYHIHKGGDGYPVHFYEYKCPVCDKLFYV